ncbi:MAG TPA: rhodanese-like domain-containing protein [Vicinamibacterales bacterium]|jgi:glyoxylase-like metal-dependent hydrolase (beta-lactamase superfamily II)/rhodanese-related sulfurtransferase|nr:rhodanese-like domain-containing protein [Vicinamibacterales bacterium]
MILEQFYLKCLAHASYLVGDAQSHVAAVIDPQRDIDQYLAYAAEHDLKIKHVILTHLHADFIAGHLELRDRAGATIYLGANASAEYTFTPLADGDRIDFGRVRLQALSTPGHTPESISIEVFDLDRSAAEPFAVLTGDTLFVGDVGRPDLRAALGWSAADLGGLLYDSLHSKLLSLPDASLVYPAHGAGSLCGKAISAETVSTIGTQRRANYALQPMTRQAFVDLITADQPDAPPYFTYDAVLNSRERPTLEASLAVGLNPISVERLLDLQRAGAQVLDTRDPVDFAAAHLAGSINIGLDGQYATWAGTVLSRERPIVIVADPGREHQSAIRLGRIGFDHVAGYLKDGLRSLESRPELTATTERLSPPLAAERLGADRPPEPPVVIDVRAPAERAQKAIAGSVSVPLNQLLDRFGELPADRPLLVYCAGGYRSSIAASLLQARGFTAVSEIAGGIAAWESAHLPLQP